MPYGESGCRGASSAAGRVAFAVDRAAGRAEDDLAPVCAPLRRTRTVPTTLTSASKDGSLDRGADVGLGGQVEAHLGSRLRERDGGVVRMSPSCSGAGRDELARARGEIVEDVHLVAALDAGRRRRASR